MGSTTPHTSCFATRARRQRKACVQCTRAKRKCDQTTPACHRCSERGIHCTYSPLGRNPSVLHDASAASAPSLEETSEAHTGAPTPSVSAEHGQAPLNTLGRCEDSSFSRVQASGTDIAPDCRWFLSANAWILKHGSPAIGRLPVSEETLPYFVDKIKHWVIAWTREGHSPLIHRRIYGSRLPAVLQDAYTSLAAYNAAATPAAKATALNIMEDRVNLLVSSQPCPASGNDNDDDHELSSSLLVDTPTHLARTQALFVYVLVRLFDGDVRARAQADIHLDKLLAWGKQMLESARLDCVTAEMASARDTAGLGAMLCTADWQSVTPLLLSDPAENHNATNPAANSIRLGPSTPPNQPNTPLHATATLSNNADPNNHNMHIADPPSTNPFSLPSPSPTTSSSSLTSAAPHLWRAWIHAESVRRTYIASVLVQSIYHTFKRGWSLCPGMPVFTAQAGLWDAPSAQAWLSKVVEGGQWWVKGGCLRGHRQGQLDESGGGNDGGCVKVQGLSPWVMVQSLDAWGVIEAGRPEEVDEFAVGVLEVNYGMERVAQWRFEKGGVRG